MGDVYDFRTGRLCKLCLECHWWKDVVADFPIGTGKYDRLDFCYSCAGIEKPKTDLVPDDDDVA